MTPKGVILEIAYRASGALARVICGPDIKCSGHGCSREDCYPDSRGVYRCNTCAGEIA